MKFRILGPIEVLRDDGEPVELGKRKERALLARLLIDMDEAVSADRCIDALWPSGPPARVDASLHSIVARLRRSLEPDRQASEPPTRLIREAGGYRIVARHEELDSRRFVQAADRGRALLDAGDAVGARPHLRAALGEWRGAALGEFAYEPFADRAAHHLETLRTDTIEAELVARVAAGEDESTGELETFVAAHPLRENPWVALMVALYRTGRQTEALRRGEELRRSLAEVGLEPSRRVRRIVAAILAHDPALETSELILGTDRVPPVAVTTPAPELPRWWQPGDHFVGRTSELEILRDGWRRCRDHGDTVVAVITGEPGIGKSTLAIEMAERALASGARILAGRSSPTPVLPFEPLGEALGRLVDTLDDRDIADLGAHAPRLSHLLPDAVERLGRPDRVEPRGDDVERHLLHEAVGALIAQQTATHPTGLLIDDLQWADSETPLLVDHLLRSDRSRSLFVLVTIRKQDLRADTRLRSLVDSWCRSGVGVEIDLGGLGAAEVAELVDAHGAAFTADADDPLGPIRHLLDATAGNPFFVIEMARRVGEGTASFAASEVPASVHALVRSRLDRLSTGHRRVLQLAALQGGRVELDVLEEIVGDGSAPDAIDTAVVEGLLIERNGVVFFRHDLVRTVLEAEIGPSQRTRWHRELGNAYLARAADDPMPLIDRIAHHFVAAAADGDATDAVRYSILAGGNAWDALAYDAAVRSYEAGLDALRHARPVDASLRVELQLSLLEGHRLLGDIEGVIAGLAAHSDDIERHGSLVQLRRYAMVFAHVGLVVPPEHAETYDRRLARVEERLGHFDTVAEEDVAVIALARSLVAARRGRSTDASTRFSDLLERRSPEWPLELHVMIADAALGVLAERAPVAERVDLIAQVFDMVMEDSSSLLEHRILITSLSRWATMSTGRVGEALEMDERLEAQASLLGMPRYLAGTAQRRAAVELARGQVDAAEHDAEQATVHQPDAEFFEGYLAQLAMIRHHQGRVVELVDALDSMEGHPEPAWLAGRAWMFAELADRRDEAADLLGRFVEGLDRWERGVSWLAALALAARAADSLADGGAADPLIDALEPHAGRIVQAGQSALILGPVDLHLGMLEAAAGRTRAAVSALEAADEPLHLLDAEALVAHRELVHAEILARSSSTAQRHRAVPYLTRATASIRRLGIRSTLAARARRLADFLGEDAETR